MKKEFIVIAFESDKHGRKVIKYDAADYAWAATVVGCLIRRKSDECVVLMIPNSRIFYVTLMEEEEI